MRELKFRAWDNRNKEFIYFVLEHGDAHSGPMEDQCNNLDLESWQQFTGLKDKNGKEIYDGDILQWSDGAIYNRYLVRWSNARAMFYFQYGPTPGVSRSPNHNHLMEVIGNIHENKELLNG